MTQYEAVTGRRPRIRYADVVKGEAPLARSRFFEERARKQQASQFDEMTEFERKQAEEAAKRAAEAEALSTAGLGLEAGTLGYDALFGGAEAAAPAADAAITGLGTDASISGLGAESGTLGAEAGSAGSSSGSLAGLGYIAAAAALQKGMANAITDEYRGQQYRDALYINPETGNYEPGFTAEPWQDYLGEQFGFYDGEKGQVSSGRKFDAAIYNDEYGTAAKTIPSTATQWVDPVGTFGYDFAKGDLMNRFGWDDQQADTLMSFVDPIHGAGKLVEDSHFCTAIHKYAGLTLGQMKSLAKLKKYGLKNHTKLAEFYINSAKNVVGAVNQKGHFKLWADLKNILIIPVVKCIKNKDLEGAWNIYKNISMRLYEMYAPETYEELVNG